ncbi:MAG: TlpA family protein disulfide reductase, partial [Clostridiales bacterium]|nr:TlpA family protein disulfide reductase [Clostridiales bacterium]
SIPNPPAGSVADVLTVTGKNPGAIFEMRAGNTVTYSVTVRSEGGLKFKNTNVQVYKGADISAEGLAVSSKTNAAGVLEFTNEPGNYTVVLPTVQEGYTIIKQATLTAAVRQSEIVLSSSVIMAQPPAPKTDTNPNGHQYKIGDIIHNFTFTTPYDVDGSPKTYSIADLLKEKEAVVINNWGTNCTYCVKEMPAMQAMYENYSDRIEILAISNYMGGDSDSAINSYIASEAAKGNNYTFPLMRDKSGLGSHFNIQGWPTTIVIDRYGAIAHIEEGAILQTEVWERLVDKFVGDNYVQSFNPGDEKSDPVTSEVAKPDVVLPENHYELVATAINKFTATDNMYVKWAGVNKDEENAEYVWPFILKKEAGISPDLEVLCASNSGKHNSWAIIYADVKMPLGKVFTFDFYSDTEEYYDAFSAVWDGRNIWTISGKSEDGWATCYLYSELDTDEHSLALAYIKDGSTSEGKDNVYIRNVRFEDISNITSADMLRGAAFGVPAENATEFPHYAPVEIGSDGYYHVNTSELENGEYAGDDNSPMLFANMTGVTNWSNRYSVYELAAGVDEDGYYVVDCNFTIGGVARDYRNDIIEYCRIASFSDIEGYVPVDEELRALLDAFVKSAAPDFYHANKSWLELCYFFSHYGEGEPTGNPIIGLTKKTAIPVALDEEVTANITRIMTPFPSVIYSFTPSDSAVYKVESLLEGTDRGAQVWLFDDDTDDVNALIYDGNDRFNRDGRNEQNFSIYHYMTEGKTYYIKVAFLMDEGVPISGQMNFKVTEIGASYTELKPASAGYFTMELGPDGETILGTTLQGAVEYELDGGYYRVKHADGSLGSYIYLDVDYATRVTIAFKDLVNKKAQNPVTHADLSYSMFDFRYAPAYYDVEENGEKETLLITDFDLTQYGPKDRVFKDYTDIMKGYVASAEDGLVKVDEPLMKILQLLIEVRMNDVSFDAETSVVEYEAALYNEWLRFCWYYKTHNAQNP